MRTILYIVRKEKWDVTLNNVQDVVDGQQKEREARKATLNYFAGRYSKFRYEDIYFNYLNSGRQL